MKVKTSELIGPALDWAACFADGRNYVYQETEYSVDGRIFQRGISQPTGPHLSKDWAQGGPIKERERIATRYSKGKWYAMRSEDLGDGERAQWCQYTFRGMPRSAPTSRQCRFSAESELVAVMRCYVAYKLGEVVDVPDWLLA